ncbi:MAG: DEAD/DEAH box helicase [Pseudomonadota bacterium]|nr:DEAD/DEAH box helicase [Pseudomonadota bacterium]
MDFGDLGLSEEVLKAVRDVGYTKPTPIQEAVIPLILMGRDILGCADTGTGKTASFTLPMIDVLATGRAKARMPRTIIMEPTRELATQVAENFETYGKYTKLTKALIIGGTSMEEQSKVIDKGVDVLIATPGRLLDLFDRGELLLNDVKILVIDEADRMLDMGFIPDIEKIASLLNKIRQTLLFSATMPKEIRRLAEVFLINAKEVTVKPTSGDADKIRQGLLFIKHSNERDLKSLQEKKRAALRTLIKSENVTNALIFCNKKRDVDIVNRSLQKHGYVAGKLHGDMSQPARTETMNQFRDGAISLLVCSDVAARGLDIIDLSHVFNYDVPLQAEDYIHRIGRTGRAGKTGVAYTIAWHKETNLIDDIVALTGKKIPIISDQKMKYHTTGDPIKKRKQTKQNNTKGKVGGSEKTNETGKREDDKVVTGMGDHTPAFLLNSIEI